MVELFAFTPNFIHSLNYPIPLFFPRQRRINREIGHVDVFRQRFIQNRYDDVGRQTGEIDALIHAQYKISNYRLNNGSHFSRTVLILKGP